MNEPSASQLGISKRRCFLTGADLVGLVGRPNGSSLHAHTGPRCCRVNSDAL